MGSVLNFASRFQISEKLWKLVFWHSVYTMQSSKEDYKLGGVSWPRGHVSSPRVGAPVPGPELVAGLSQGQGRGWGLGCRPGECSLGRGSPAPAAHFPPRPRAERLTGSALLLRPRERAGPRGSALRTDLENRQTRCVCETEKARRPWSNPEGR